MKMDLSYTVLCIVCVVYTVVPLIGACPPQCHDCDQGTANCIQTGLRDIPQQFPEEVEVLDLTGNHITDLNRNSFQSLPNVLSLRIPNNGISQIGERSFQNLPHLTMLDLSSNALSTIDDGAFEGLTQLSIVTLTNNRLRRLGRPFEGLTSLSSVYLGFNQLTEIEEDDFQTNSMIRMLDLSNNRIAHIHPMAFKNLKNLRYLILSNNHFSHNVELEFTSTMLQLVDFTKSHLKKVPQGMPYSVADFRLGNNMITEIGDEDFTGMTHLRLLMMENNLIRNVSYRAFKPLKNLKEMWLSHNEMFYIPQGLPSNLETFYLDNNQIFEIPSMIFQNDSNIKVLSFEMNKIQNVSPNAFKGLKNLQQVNLQFNKIAQIQARTFSHLPSLTTLQLSYNPIVAFEREAFLQLPQLSSLSLSNIESPDVYLTEDFLLSMSTINTLEFMSSAGLVNSLMAVLNQAGKSADLGQVRTLNLQYNDLRTLPNTLQTALENVERLFLDGNSFHCDKRLIWLKNWIAEGRVTFYNVEEPQCATPPQLMGQKIQDLSYRDFVDVAPEVPQSRDNTGPVEISRVRLTAPVISESGPIATESRPDVPPSNSLSAQTDIGRLQEAPISVPANTDSNPTPRPNKSNAKNKRKGRKRKGKKNRRKNKKGKKKKRNRGKRHNKKGGRRRRCRKLTDGTVRCKRPRGKKRPKVAQGSSTDQLHPSV